MPKKSERIAVVVLAAGLGKRMKSELPKVLHPVGGQPMILRVLKNLGVLKPERAVIVIGHGGELVQEVVNSAAKAGSIPKCEYLFAKQNEPRGTGDAVKSALPLLEDFTGTVLVACGDAPLLTNRSIQGLVSAHSMNSATLSLLTVILRDPAQYGRIIRDSKNASIQKVTEAKDCSEAQLKINEINISVYAVDSAFLMPAVKRLTNNNAQGEYYLTDIVESASNEGQTISSFIVDDENEALGINTKKDLAMVEAALRTKIIDRLLEQGVTFVDPHSAYIEESVKIESGVVIGPNTQIFGNSKIAAGVQIEGTAYIADSEIGTNTKLKLGVRIEGCKIGKECSVGPFANLREGTVLEDQVKIGDFVETKKAVFKKGAKASHLSYLGDAEIGEEANIGAGTITCNYDGFVKSKTKIGKGAFIGSNTALVAPLEIGEGAVVGAGSTIAKKNVEADALAFTRADLTIRSGWAKSQRAKHKKQTK